MTDIINNERPSRIDRPQLIAVLLLMLLSIAFVYSATYLNESAVTHFYRQTFFKQFIWFALGIAAAAAVCTVDYHVLCRWSYVAYWASILILIAVLIPGIGRTHLGARRWIGLPGFEFQPSEIAKFAFILAQANFLSRPADELRLPAIFWKSLGLIALPFVLIMKEPDLGSALVLVPTGLIMLAVAGTPPRYLLQLIGIGAVLGGLLVADLLYAPPKYRIPIVKEYQVKRLLVYFGRNYVSYSATGGDPAEQRRSKEEQSKDEYNVKQAMIAVGSGGMWGKGWRQGQQNALGYVPKAGKHNDFIFCVIAEELGFFGSAVVLALYAVILFTGIRIAGQARDRLGKLLAVGVVTLLFSHIFINIGMNIRIMPVTGIPLPLLSYGGTSVLGSLIAIGLLQNIYIYRKAY